MDWAWKDGRHVHHHALMCLPGQPVAPTPILYADKHAGCGVGPFNLRRRGNSALSLR